MFWVYCLNFASTSPFNLGYLDFYLNKLTTDE